MARSSNPASCMCARARETAVVLAAVARLSRPCSPFAPARYIPGERLGSPFAPSLYRGGKAGLAFRALATSKGHFCQEVVPLLHPGDGLLSFPGAFALHPGGPPHVELPLLLPDADHLAAVRRRDLGVLVLLELDERTASAARAIQVVHRSARWSVGGLLVRSSSSAFARGGGGRRRPPPPRSDKTAAAVVGAGCVRRRWRWQRTFVIATQNELHGHRGTSASRHVIVGVGTEDPLLE